jgi:hypothetical protein
MDVGEWGERGWQCYVCEYGVMGFQRGTFSWFPDQNTIVCIHEMRLLCRVPHFSRKLGRTQWDEYQVTNETIGEYVCPGFRTRLQCSFRMSWGHSGSYLFLQCVSQVATWLQTHGWQVYNGNIPIHGYSSLLGLWRRVTGWVYPTFRRTVLRLSSIIKQSKKKSCHFFYFVLWPTNA